MRPTRREVEAAMKLLGPPEGMKMRTKVVHNRLDRAGRTRDEEPIADIEERAAIETTRPPVDDDDVPAILPVLVEPDVTEHGGDDE